LSAINPFETNTGSARLGSPGFYIPVALVCIISAWIVVELGLAGGLAIIVFPFLAIYLNLLFKKPIVGLYTSIAFGFILLGVHRYVEVPQIGIFMDSILVLSFISIFFKNFDQRIDWKPAKKDITLLAGIWLAFGLMSVANPELKSVEVWLSSFRGVSVYMFLVIVLTLLLMTTRKSINIFIYIWAIFSILVTMKGIMQEYLGVDQWEKAWLDGGAYKTHILFGKLRVFSFLSDAGQFGATQAYAGVVFIILSFIEKNKKKKVFFLITGVLGLFGMLLSGTRGAISVPLTGFMLYFVLRKNIAVLSSGIFLLAVVFVFFKYTTIGQDNQQIRRMRTAFDPNDASLQTRLANQRTLSVYLSTRPLGGGLGHAGKKALKSLPNTFLANIATDSWYVMIWAELGVIGLSLHLFILFYIIFKTTYLVWFRIRDPNLKMTIMALASGMFGIMVASYGNAVLGSMPTSMLIYTSMALMLNAEVLDKEYEQEASSLEIPPMLPVNQISAATP
jgi:hypothetical protein